MISGLLQEKPASRRALFLDVTFVLNSSFPTPHPKILLERRWLLTTPKEERSAVGPAPLRSATRGGLQRGSAKQQHGEASRRTVGPNQRRAAQADSQGGAGDRAPRWDDPPGRSSRLSTLQAQRPAKIQQLSPPCLERLAGSVGQDRSVQQHGEEEREQEDERDVEHAARSRL